MVKKSNLMKLYGGVVMSFVYLGIMILLWKECGFFWEPKYIIAPIAPIALIAIIIFIRRDENQRRIQKVKEEFGLDVSEGTFVLDDEDYKRLDTYYSSQMIRTRYSFRNHDILDQLPFNGMMWEALPLDPSVQDMIDHMDPPRFNWSIPRSARTGYYSAVNLSDGVEDFASRQFPEQEGLHVKIAVFDTVSNELCLAQYHRFTADSPLADFVKR